MNGKGDTPRPKSVSYEIWSDNWKLIFGEKKKEKPMPNPPNEDNSLSCCNKTT